MFGRRLHTARMVNKQHYKGNHAIIDLESEKSYIGDLETKTQPTGLQNQPYLRMVSQNFDEIHSIVSLS